jgi:hypothetical protein
MVVTTNGSKVSMFSLRQRAGDAYKWDSRHVPVVIRSGHNSASDACSASRVRSAVCVVARGYLVVFVGGEVVATGNAMWYVGCFGAGRRRLCVREVSVVCAPRPFAGSHDRMLCPALGRGDTRARSLLSVSL